MSEFVCIGHTNYGHWAGAPYTLRVERWVPIGIYWALAF